MFTVAERDQVRARLLEAARTDQIILAAAITGSYALDASDEWSDIDLAFSVDGAIQTALARWTDLLYADFGALHHWDLPVGGSVYRVFLLPGGLEVDIAFMPVAEFGPVAPSWRPVFGTTLEPVPARPPRTGHRELAGLGWHHVLHARTCIERGKLWQAEWLISGIRDHVLELACRRYGYPASYAKGADQLPAELTEPVRATLVRSLDEPELRRALAAATAVLNAELAWTDPELAARLRSLFDEVDVEIGLPTSTPG